MVLERREEGNTFRFSHVYIVLIFKFVPPLWSQDRPVLFFKSCRSYVQSAIGEEDGAAQIAKHARWLKGAGGTVGFQCFTEPARRLELSAEFATADEIQITIDELKRFAEQIEMPWTTTAVPS